MPEGPSDRRPIQVFLDTRRFIELEEPQPFAGASKDFFAGNDAGFLEHKTKLKGRVQALANSLRRSKQPGGFVKVRQREEALAKTRRPLGHLFTESNRFALVGAESVGELLFQSSAASLNRLANIIETKAELAPRIVTNKKTGKKEARVSGYRSELGGIEDIQLYTAADRIPFSTQEAIEWLRQPNVIGGYVVELFRPARHIDPEVVEELISDLRKTLEGIPGGLIIRPILPAARTAQYGQPSLTLSIHLVAGERRYVELPFLADGRGAEISEASLSGDWHRIERDLDAGRHAILLESLAEQTLVRTVELPPALETTPAMQGSTLGSVTLAAPQIGADYPAVAIIDGGIATNASLDAWKVGDAGLVPASERDESHGTFIAGLVCGGGALNPTIAADIEPAGCRFFDLDLFPRRELRQQYYPDIEDLFDTLDEKIKVAKRDHGIRIFNLSFAIGKRSSRLSYSLAADRLDRIARSNDVLFVVSAGNLASADCRPPWPGKPDEALAMLAAHSGYDQQITAPAEHCLGITIGAVNTAGLAGHEPQLPTTYTRRGPGVGGARKPDLAHYGGVSATAAGPTGLISLTPTGDAVPSCGTSFAAPLAAATLATLDQRLARLAPRETLIALPIHRARRPADLDRPTLRHIARDFVGFGIAPPADSILSDEPHSVTLVFSDRLLAKQRLEFPFSWPKSLVREGGACRGRADVTLSFTPPIDPDHREEAIRVQLEAHLHQECLEADTGELSWESRLTQDAAKVPQGLPKTESFLIKAGLKWSPTKRYHLAMPEGRGNTSNWRLSLESLVRAGEKFPTDGVRFSLLLTISDIDAAAPIREEMRLDIQNRGLVLADITVAHRVRTRGA